MTVASLWKALDRAGCGRPIGAAELRDHHRLRMKRKQNSCDCNDVQGEIANQRPALAIDLSIWICEALASSAMKINQTSDPACSLVYTRTLKLLNLGIKLIAVVEGKRRVRQQQQTPSDEVEQALSLDKENQKQQQQDKFRKRRGGAPFWSACQRCQKMLLQMGVVVVRAKAEGEALCALLNQRGVVDGVISKDGDCFLFGAKVLYTHFSIENLEQKRVMRYDIDDLRICVDDDDGNWHDETRQVASDGRQVVNMSRNDLIAFAILTGSDLAGDGISMVGCRKAIRFIRKCQIDNPMKVLDETECSSPALELLKTWEKLATRLACTSHSEDTSVKQKHEGPTCSCCGHDGNKSNHKKHGCKECDTGPGEDCIFLSPGARFKASLQPRVMEQLKANFGPSAVANIYYNPNDNQLPLSLVGMTARNLQMRSPRFDDLMKSSFLVRGRSIRDSRTFLQRSIASYMARFELFRQVDDAENENSPGKNITSKGLVNYNRAVPIQLSCRRVKNGKPCFEVLWMVKATMTNDEGDPIDEFEFSTIEQEFMLKKCFPNLLRDFASKENQQSISNNQNPLEFFLKSGINIDAVEEGQSAVDNRNNHAQKKTKTVAQQRQSLQRPKPEYRAGGPSDDVMNLRQKIQSLHPEKSRSDVARVLFQSDQECYDQSNERKLKAEKSVPIICHGQSLWPDPKSSADRMKKQSHERFLNEQRDENDSTFSQRGDCALLRVSSEQPQTNTKSSCHFDSRRHHEAFFHDEEDINGTSYCLQKGCTLLAATDELQQKLIVPGHNEHLLTTFDAIQKVSNDYRRWSKENGVLRVFQDGSLSKPPHIDDSELSYSQLSRANTSVHCLRFDQQKLETYERPDGLTYSFLYDDELRTFNADDDHDDRRYDLPHQELSSSTISRTDEMLLSERTEKKDHAFCPRLEDKMLDYSESLSSPVPKRAKSLLYDADPHDRDDDHLTTDPRSGYGTRKVRGEENFYPSDDTDTYPLSTIPDPNEFNMMVDQKVESKNVFEYSICPLNYKEFKADSDSVKVAERLYDVYDSVGFDDLDEFLDWQEDKHYFDGLGPDEKHRMGCETKVDVHSPTGASEPTSRTYEKRIWNIYYGHEQMGNLSFDDNVEDYSNDLNSNALDNFTKEDFLIDGGTFEGMQSQEQLWNKTVKHHHVPDTLESRSREDENGSSGGSSLGLELSKIIEAEVKRRIEIELKSLDRYRVNEYL